MLNQLSADKSYANVYIYIYKGTIYNTDSSDKGFSFILKY